MGQPRVEPLIHLNGVAEIQRCPSIYTKGVVAVKGCQKGASSKLACGEAVSPFELSCIRECIPPDRAGLNGHIGAM